MQSDDVDTKHTNNLQFGRSSAESYQDLAFQQLSNLRVLHPQKLLDQLCHLHLPVAPQQEVLLAEPVPVRGAPNFSALCNKVCEDAQGGALVLGPAGAVCPLCCIILPVICDPFIPTEIEKRSG